MKVADLHVHTNLSMDTHGKGMYPHEAVELAHSIGLSAIAITDHHEIADAIEARNYAAKRNIPLDVVIGVEVSTNHGHILGLFVEEPIEPVNDPFEAVDRIHKQGGLAIIPHPFVRTINGRQRQSIGFNLKNVVSLAREAKIDGFEVYSAGSGDISFVRNHREDRKPNNLARRIYNLMGSKLGAAISSSDGHGLTLGRGITAFEEDLRTAIEKRTTVPMQPQIEELKEIIMAAMDHFGEERIRSSESLMRRKFTKHQIPNKHRD